MSSILKGMDQAAPGTAYSSVEAEPTFAAGQRWHQVVATAFFGGTRRSRVDAFETHRRRARDDQRLCELMVSAQSGDKASYARLLAGCEPLVRRAAQRVGVQGDLIEQVVQETLITIHNARQTYDPSRSFSAWLSTIAQRRAIDALRRSGRHARRESHAPLDDKRHPDPDADASSSRWDTARFRHLPQAIAGLALGQREAVERVAMQGQSFAEASAPTGRTKGALKVTFHRTLEALKERLARQDAGRDC